MVERESVAGAVVVAVVVGFGRRYFFVAFKQVNIGSVTIKHGI